MITPSQINAEEMDPPLTDEQILNLEMLVKRYKPYYTAQGRWPDLTTRLKGEQDEPTVKTMALKAVLTALNGLPSIVVESQGQRTAPAFFGTTQNWDALALDVLNILYEVAPINGQEYFVTVKKQVQSMIINDDISPLFNENNTGRRYD